MIHSRKMARIFAAALLILMAVFFTAQFKAKAAEATESATEEAEEEKDDSATKGKAVAAAVAIGLAAVPVPLVRNGIISPGFITVMMMHSANGISDTNRP